MTGLERSAATATTVPQRQMAEVCKDSSAQREASAQSEGET
eukprot:CAMPEP_0171242326 /NCGR_PEP_ID=MMETSP0790-20130122/45624_1 /TAXON_ID=2925 /ORGANISM="Alexandrium catenella, Strain OF101" /LENGTH=40 /DNA_ID= /DNA_START= /DNA_END= /DNA_ORIENTATION=